MDCFCSNGQTLNRSTMAATSVDEDSLSQMRRQQQDNMEEAGGGSPMDSSQKGVEIIEQQHVTSKAINNDPNSTNVNDHCDRLIYHYTGYQPLAHRVQQTNPTEVSNNKAIPELTVTPRNSEPECESSDEIFSQIESRQRTISESSNRGKLKQFWSTMKRNFGSVKDQQPSRSATPIIVCDSSDSEQNDHHNLKPQSKSNKRSTWKWGSSKKKSKSPIRLYSSNPDLSRLNLHDDCLNFSAVSDVEDNTRSIKNRNYLDVNNNSPNYSESESEEITIERKPEKWSNHSPTMFRFRKLKKEIQRCVNRQRDSSVGSVKGFSSSNLPQQQKRDRNEAVLAASMPPPPQPPQPPLLSSSLTMQQPCDNGNDIVPMNDYKNVSAIYQHHHTGNEQVHVQPNEEGDTDTIGALNLRPAKPGNKFTMSRIARNSSQESDSDHVPDYHPADTDQGMIPRKISLDTSENYDEIVRNQRIHRLLKYPFFQVDIHLQCGQGLLAKDSSGTSDPYVKFKIGNQIVHKSQTIFKTLNPVWDEYFVLPTNNIYDPIILKVYDYDYLMLDDYLGTTAIDLTRLEPGVTTDLELDLYDDSKNIDNQKPENRGKIFLSVRLNPKTQEERDYYYGRGKWTVTAGADGQPSKKTKSQPYDGIVSVVLIKGSDIDLDGDYCMRLKLGSEKFKSRVVSKSVQSPYWAQEFTMHMFADQPKMLEMTLGLAGTTNQDLTDKACIDLSQLEPEKTHKFNQQFNFPVNPKISGAKPKKPGVVEMLVTITGTQLTKGNDSGDTGIVSGDSNIQNSARPESPNQSLKNYVVDNVSRMYENFFDVGTLTVKVHRAENLASADINGKSDPFCVLELVNERLRTNTEYKTLSPEWNKTFKLKIHDIHDVLEITVYDEDKDRVEFLGKVAIPLLRIKNGEKRWYALKDKKLKQRAKGHILLEFEISYNILKASLITFGPRKTKYIQPEVKFKRSLFIRNVMRLKQIGLEVLEVGQWLHSCIQWESPSRSIIAFLTFLTFVYYFEFYMLPLILLIFVLKNYAVEKYQNYLKNENDEINDKKIDDDYFIDEIKSDDEYDGDEKKSLKERIVTVQEISVLLMNIVGLIASYVERIKNATNFTVPYLTWLGLTVLAGCTIVFYFIPVRYLILIWGINKFTKKFRCPDGVNNNEVIDYLSRVPDNEELILYKEFKPTINYDSEGRIIPAGSSISRSVSPESDPSRSSSPGSRIGDRREKKKNK